MESKFLGKAGRTLFGFENLTKDTSKPAADLNDARSVPDDISSASSGTHVMKEGSKASINKEPVNLSEKKLRFSPQKLISPVKSIKNFIARRNNHSKADSNTVDDDGDDTNESTISPDQIVSGKFRLRGKYLSYYSKNEGDVVTLDISDCKVRLGATESLNDGTLKFTYYITTKEKEHCFTSSSEKSRLTSMIILHEQIQAWKSIANVLIPPSEICFGFGIVNRKRSAIITSGSFTTVTMALTNQHRLLFFQQMSTSLQEQITWTSSTLPTFTKISKTKFRIELEEGRRSLEFEDVKSGSSYWQLVFEQIRQPEQFTTQISTQIPEKLAGQSSSQSSKDGIISDAAMTSKSEASTTQSTSSKTAAVSGNQEDSPTKKSGSSKWAGRMGPLSAIFASFNSHAAVEHGNNNATETIGSAESSESSPPLSPLDKPLVLTVDSEVPLTHSPVKTAFGSKVASPVVSAVGSAQATSPVSEAAAMALQNITDTCTEICNTKDSTAEEDLSPSTESTSDCKITLNESADPASVFSSATDSNDTQNKTKASLWGGMVELVSDICFCAKGVMSSNSSTSAVTHPSTAQESSVIADDGETMKSYVTTMSPRIPDADEEVTL